MTELAVFYARVSTTNKEQETSIESQKKMCLDFLQRNPEIQLAEPIDEYCEKISAKTDDRPKYRKMMNRIEEGDIRYIIIKDTKRISRASDVSAQLRNTLKRNKMKLIILSEGGVIKDVNADENRMIYGFEALMAEELVFTQSRYGRLAHQQKCKDKRLNRNNITFGYRWNKELETIEVDEEQANIIKKIFEMHTLLGKSISDIQLYLNENGYQYSKPTIRKWLKQETYIGVFYLNQKGSELGVGIGGKTKRFVNPKEEWVRVDRPDLRIIPDELFYLTQRLFESKNELYGHSSLGTKQARFEGTALFSGKIFCGECNKSYIHRYAGKNQDIGIYVDSFKIKTKNPKISCPNKHTRLYEDDFISIYKQIKREIIKNNNQSLERLRSIVNDIISKKKGAEEEILSVNQKLEKLQKKANDLTLNYISAPDNMKNRIQSLYDECEKQIAELKQRQEEIQENKGNKDILLKRISAVDKVFEMFKSMDNNSDFVEREEVKKLIHKIVVYDSGIVKLYFNQSMIVMPNKVPIECKLMEFEADFSERCTNYNSVSRKYKVEVFITI